MSVPLGLIHCLEGPRSLAESHNDSHGDTWSSHLKGLVQRARWAQVLCHSPINLQPPDGI